MLYRKASRGALFIAALASFTLAWVSLPMASATADPGAGPALSSSGAGYVGLPTPAKVPVADTDGQPAASLLANALQLLRVGSDGSTLVAAMTSTESKLQADAAAARKAQSVAEAAEARAASAASRASEAEAAYQQMAAAVRAAAIYLYMTGGGSQGDGPASAGAPQQDGAEYTASTVGPAGVMSASFQLAQQDRDDLATATSYRQTAEAAMRRAAGVLAAERSEVGSLQDRLESTPNISAGTVASDELTLASQAGGELAGSNGLQFTPKAPIPAPLSTTAYALAWAFSELGKPYLWGGTGPAEFDCSGLTQYVWRQAGAQIPRVAAAQYSWTVPVPLSQLLPGDLVFYGTTDIHHVGMYIGDGLMINAPHTGTVVQVSSIWWSDLAGFGRVHTAGTPVPARVAPTTSSPAVRAVVATSKPVPSQAAPSVDQKPASSDTSPAADSSPTSDESSAGSAPTTPATTVAPPDSTTTTSTTTLADPLSGL